MVRGDSLPLFHASRTEARVTRSMNRQLSDRFSDHKYLQRFELLKIINCHNQFVIYGWYFRQTCPDKKNLGHCAVELSCQKSVKYIEEINYDAKRVFSISVVLGKLKWKRKFKFNPKHFARKCAKSFGCQWKPYYKLLWKNGLLQHE